MNDGDTGALDDNYIPLHESVELACSGSLLPMRFLGKEFSTGKIDQLLQQFLDIKIFEFFPDNTSKGIPITCVELGSQFLFITNNFLNLYHSYLVDCRQMLKQQQEQLDLFSKQKSQTTDPNHCQWRYIEWRWDRSWANELC